MLRVFEHSEDIVLEGLKIFIALLAISCDYVFNCDGLWDDLVVGFPSGLVWQSFKFFNQESTGTVTDSFEVLEDSSEPQPELVQVNWRFGWGW